MKCYYHEIILNENLLTGKILIMTIIKLMDQSGTTPVVVLAIRKSLNMANEWYTIGNVIRRIDEKTNKAVSPAAHFFGINSSRSKVHRFTAVFYHC